MKIKCDCEAFCRIQCWISNWSNNLVQSSFTYLCTSRLRTHWSFFYLFRSKLGSQSICPFGHWMGRFRGVIQAHLFAITNDQYYRYILSRSCCPFDMSWREAARIVNFRCIQRNNHAHLVKSWKCLGCCLFYEVYWFFNLLIWAPWLFWVIKRKWKCFE